MTYRAKIGFSHWWQTLILFITPVIIIIMYKSMTDGLPFFIDLGVYGVSVISVACGFVALSAVLRTDYTLDDNYISINYNRDKPIVISYDRLEAFEIKPSLKTFDALSYARSSDVLFLKYSDENDKKTWIKISPVNLRVFFEDLERKKKRFDIRNSKKEETTEKENIENTDEADDNIYESEDEEEIDDSSEETDENDNDVIYEDDDIEEDGDDYINTVKGFEINLKDNFFDDNEEDDKSDDD